MGKRIILSGFLLVACWVLLNGCSYMATGLSDASTPVSPGTYKVLGHASGSNTFVSIFGIIPLGHPNYNAAISDAETNYTNGKSLINVRSYFSTTNLFLININTLTVEGDVITF
jgi:hypothetical protein